MKPELALLSYAISPEDSARVECAIKFLVDNYSATGHNPKPVILHSLRVAMYLLELGYETDLIIAAALHDLLEDTAVTPDQIKQEFGASIARLVEAVSFKPDITNSVAQYRDMFTRVVAAGRSAVIVKAADIHSNSLYIPLAPESQQRFLKEKIQAFLEHADEYKDELVVKRLAVRSRELDS